MSSGIGIYWVAVELQNADFPAGLNLVHVLDQGI